MRFEKYLSEEYLMRVRSFEIFKNPSNKEISDLSKQTRGTIRILLDEEDKDNWYIFPSALLHKYALESMIEDEQVLWNRGKYRSAEVYILPDKIALSIFHGTYIVKNGEIQYKTTDYNKKEIKKL